MRGNKGFIFKSLLVLLLFAVVFGMVGFILVSQAKTTVTKSMMDTVGFNARSAATTVNQIFSENLEEASSSDLIDGKRYQARGTLFGDLLSVTFADGTKLENARIQTGVRQEFVTNTLLVYSLSDVLSPSYLGLLPDVDKQENIYFYMQPAAEEGVVSVLMQKQTQFFTQLGALSQGGSTFAYSIFARGDEIYFTSDGTVLPLKSALNQTLIGNIENKPLDAIAFNAELNGKMYVVGAYRIAAVSTGAVKYYYFGFTDIAAIEAQVSKFTTDIILVVAFCFLFVAVLVILYGLLTKPSRKMKVQMANSLSADAKEQYVLTVDGEGVISESTSEFDRHFSVRNLAACVVFKSFNATLRAGDTFLCVLKDHKGDRHLMDISVLRRVKVKKSQGFQLLVSDITPLAESMASSMNVQLKTEETDVMKEVYDKLIFSRKRLLVGRIHLTNMTNLQVMFGKSFSDAVFQIVASKASERFESVFPLRADDSIGIIISQVPDFTVRCDELENDMTVMNKPINVDDNLVSVGCEGGFDLVERGVGDSSFAYVDCCVRSAMKRAACDEHKSFYVYHDFQKKQYTRYMQHDYDIKKMLEEDAFEMQFQPQYSVAEKRVSGFEALFRFSKALNMEIDTFSFIQYAERTGNMILLGNFIFEKSMDFAKSLEGKGITVSLNVSPVQFMQVGFTENLLRIYREHELQAGSVCVEITESFLMTTMDETLKKLSLLIKEGIKVHLDDFGTRYSSMLYLKKLPISAIKIDMEFIRDLCNDEYSRNITQMIINIAKQLGVESIAEGVETEEQKKMLVAMGCNHLQGFLIGKSMPAKEAFNLL